MDKNFSLFRNAEELGKVILTPNESLRSAIKKLDNAHFGIILIAEDNVLKGILTDSDIRKIILRGENLEKSVSILMNTNPVKIEYTDDNSVYEKLMIEKGLLQLPIVDRENCIIDLVIESDFFRKGYELEKHKVLDVPVVIMAGGMGTRLEPFTKILPKPLIPVGDKPILEWIMDEFGLYGISSFYLSVNHKSEMIKAYFNETNTKYLIKYIKEDKPLGTAGSLKLLETIINEDFILTNCDIIIKEKYDKIWEFHRDGEFDITIVATLQHHTIPYGVCELNGNGCLKHIKEKPEYDFLINTGMYILSPKVFSLIPQNKFYHITHLIEDAQSSGMSVGVFPIHESGWIDIGQWSEYKRAIEALKII